MKNRFFALLLVCLPTLSYAAAATSQGPSLISNILMIGGFLFIFYFLMIRPQTKRAKDHQNLISGITKDDEVITTGGIIGKVLKITDQFIVLAIAEGIEVMVQKQAISGSLPKGTMKNI